VRWHLAAAGCDIRVRADRLVQHLLAAHAEHQAHRAIAVIRIKPVVARAKNGSGRRTDGFMPGA